MHFPTLDNFIDTGIYLVKVGGLVDQHTPKVFAPSLGAFLLKRNIIFTNRLFNLSGP